MAVRASENLSDGAREDDTWLSGLILDGLRARRAAELTVVDCDQFLAECAQELNGRRSIGRDRMARGSPTLPHRRASQRDANRHPRPQRRRPLRAPGHRSE